MNFYNVLSHKTISNNGKHILHLTWHFGKMLIICHKPSLQTFVPFFCSQLQAWSQSTRKGAMAENVTAAYSLFSVFLQSLRGTYLSSPTVIHTLSTKVRNSLLRDHPFGFITLYFLTVPKFTLGCRPGPSHSPTFYPSFSVRNKCIQCFFSFFELKHVLNKNTHTVP